MSTVAYLAPHVLSMLFYNILDQLRSAILVVKLSGYAIKFRTAVMQILFGSFLCGNKSTTICAQVAIQLVGMFFIYSQSITCIAFRRGVPVLLSTLAKFINYVPKYLVHFSHFLHRLLAFIAGYCFLYHWANYRDTKILMATYINTCNFCAHLIDTYLWHTLNYWIGIF